MNWDAADQRRFDAIRVENQQILQRFAKSGVNLSEKVVFEFTSDFASRDDAVSCRKSMVSLFGELGATGWQKDLSYIYCDYTGQGRGWQLKVSCDLVPEPDRISEIELVFAKAAEEANGSQVFWEFADPMNDTSERRGHIH